MTDNEGEFLTLSTSRLVAPTLKGNEEIDYDLRFIGDGRLYIRMLKSGGGGKVSPYSFELHRTVKALANNSPSIVGMADDGITGPCGNQNTPGFLRAIVHDLLPGMLPGQTEQKSSGAT